MLYGTAVSADPTSAEPRYALLIANSSYPDSDSPSRAASNDAHALADELKSAGFDVVLKENASASTMRDAFAALTDKVKSDSVALIYYTGFGIQVSHQTFMIPVDAQIWTEPNVSRDGISVDDVLLQLNKRGARTKIAIIDAAYRNPFERRFHAVSSGLAPTNVPDGTLSIFSTALGKMAEDNKADSSVFMTELVKQIRMPGLSGEDVFNGTRLAVSQVTGGDEVPWVSSSMIEGFKFYGSDQKGPVRQAREPVHCDGQSGPVIFDDKFVDVRGGWDLHTSIVGIRPPELVLTVGKQYAAYSTQNLIHKATDGDFCVDFVLPGPPKPDIRTSMGLQFWAADYKNFFSLQIFSDRSVGLYKHTAAGWETIFDVKTSDAVNVGAGAVNRMRLVTKGSDISAFVNGVHVKDAHVPVPAGSLRFGVYTQVGKPIADNIDFRVKAFTVTAGQ